MSIFHLAAAIHACFAVSFLISVVRYGNFTHLPLAAFFTGSAALSLAL